MNRLLILAGALSLVTGCSSSYQPARSPRIVTVMESGMPTFVKDGQSYGSPAFGSGLVDAVQGNPRATQQARLGRNLAIGGFVLDLAGLGTEVAGFAALDAHRGGDQSLGLGLLVGGLGGVLVGTILLLNAQPHMYDAVNIYNDGLDAPKQP
ncbi:MAG: hypothetical protein ABI548_14395 [Polyangiaceae bacterium]